MSVGSNRLRGSVGVVGRDKVGTRVWNTRVAPILGCIGLLAVTSLVVNNFTAPVGGSTTISTLFLVAVTTVFLGGVVGYVVDAPAPAGAGVDDGRVRPNRSAQDIS